MNKYAANYFCSAVANSWLYLFLPFYCITLQTNNSSSTGGVSQPVSTELFFRGRGETTNSTMSKLPATQDIPTAGEWFHSHGLPWTTTNELKLSGMGVECVEHFKLLQEDEWNALFVDQTIIIHSVALRVMNRLREEGEIDTKNCAKQAGKSTPSAPIPLKKIVVGKGKSKLKDQEDAMLKFGYSQKMEQIILAYYFVQNISKHALNLLMM